MSRPGRRLPAGLILFFCPKQAFQLKFSRWPTDKPYMKTIRFKGWFTKKWFKTLASILWRILWFELFVIPLCLGLSLGVLFAVFPSVPGFIKSSIESPYLIQRLFNAGLYLCIALFILFYPFFVSLKREHKSKKTIGILNFLFGWTVIGWLVLLIWALWPGCETRWTLRSKTKYPGLITDNEKVA